MRKEGRSLLLVIVGAIFLPIVFVVIQGVFALLIVYVVSVLASWIGEQYGVMVSSYMLGIVGSGLSAFCVMFPIGWLNDNTKPLVGVVIGVLSVIELIAITKVIEFITLVEYISLIIFCALSMFIGVKMRGRLEKGKT